MITFAPKFEPLEFPPGAVVDGRVSWRYVTGPVMDGDSVWHDLDEALEGILGEYGRDVAADPDYDYWSLPWLWAADRRYVGIGELDLDRVLEAVMDEHHEGARFDDEDGLRAAIQAWNERQTCWTAECSVMIDFTGYPWSRWFPDEPGHPALAELLKEFGPEEVPA